MRVTRHKVKKGYQYKVDGSIHIHGTKLFYTWAATYEVGPGRRKAVTLHSDAASARSAKGGGGWEKTGVVEIEDRG